MLMLMVMEYSISKNSKLSSRICFILNLRFVICFIEADMLYHTYNKLSYILKTWIVQNLILSLWKQNDDQVIALFMKIDSSSDGEINWVRCGTGLCFSSTVTGYVYNANEGLLYLQSFLTVNGIFASDFSSHFQRACLWLTVA